MKNIKFVLIAVLLILQINIAYANTSQYNYCKATKSDFGIYMYFSDFLHQSNRCLNNFLNENLNTKQSITLYNDIKIIYSEYQYYKTKGVKSNISKIIFPFIDLSSNIKKLRRNQILFLKNIYYLFKDKNNKTAYYVTRKALLEMEMSINKINKSIQKIENVTLWNGSKPIRFKISNLRYNILKINRLIALYNKKLNKFKYNCIVVAASNVHPYIFETIEIYIYPKNIRKIKLHIDSNIYEINQSKFKYSFNTTGIHTIFAEVSFNGMNLQSNILKIHVSKIPTKIIVPRYIVAYITQHPIIQGKIIDYFGNPLNVTLHIKLNTYTYTKKSINGVFKLNISNKLNKNNHNITYCSITFKGNIIYNKSSANITIIFSKIPIYIVLKSNRSTVPTNGTVTFSGKIVTQKMLNIPIKIHIYINSTEIKSIICKNKFTFNLTFSNSGNYIICTKFLGNQYYYPAASNIVSIHVVKNNYYRLFNTKLIIFIFLASLIILIKLKQITIKPNNNKVTINYIDKNIKFIINHKIEIPKNIQHSFRILYNLLISKYNLDNSLTPRELFKYLENESISNKLKKIIDIHEKYVYGELEINKEEEELYYSLIYQIYDVLTL